MFGVVGQARTKAGTVGFISKTSKSIPPYPPELGLPFLKTESELSVNWACVSLLLNNRIISTGRSSFL